MVRWVCQHLPLTQRVYSNVNHAFDAACADGHLRVAQWIMNVFPQCDPCMHNYAPFKHACANGYLHVAQWLEQFIPHEDRQNIAFTKRTPKSIVQWWERCK